MYTQKLDLDNLQSEHGKYDGAAVYARTKRAEVLLTEIWAQKFAGTGVMFYAMHPGWVDTPGVRSSLPQFYRVTRPLLRTPEQGADTIVWLGSAAAPAGTSGGFWHDRRERPTHRVSWTKEAAADRERLWAECQRLSGWYEAEMHAGAHQHD
jgi:NAD(P)-dependent dehydrogenase (short-subunit alcohol dehydrogenase family)